MPKKKTIPGRKHKGFYIYSRDLLSSQRYRRCSWTAKGVYLDLLNVLAVQDCPGALCLRDFDLKPQGERSLTQRCLACQRRSEKGEYQSIKYFAEAIAVSASGSRPGLIHGLQELYLRGIICIVGDTLLQPRMYRDSKLTVLDQTGQPITVGEDDYVTVLGSPDDAAADPDAERLRLGKMYREGEDKGSQTPPSDTPLNTPKKDPKKSRVGAGDAQRPRDRVRVGVGDNNNSKGNIGGVGEPPTGAVAPKTDGLVPKYGEPDPTGFWPFYNLYDKKRIGAHWINLASVYAAWQRLTDAERAAAMDFLPRYIEVTPTKRWRMHPQNFLEQRAWLHITFEGDRALHHSLDTGIDPVESAVGSVTPQVSTENAKKSPVVSAPTPVSDCPPTLAEIQAFMQESGELGRIFRYITAEEYYDDGQKNGWRQRDGRPLYDWRAQLRSYEAYRRNHGDTPVAQREQQATANRYEQTSNRHQPNRAAGTAAAPTDREVVEQSVRIMQQLRSEAERDTDEPLL